MVEVCALRVLVLFYSAGGFDREINANAIYSVGQISLIFKESMHKQDLQLSE